MKYLLVEARLAKAVAFCERCRNRRIVEALCDIARAHPAQQLIEAQVLKPGALGRDALLLDEQRIVAKGGVEVELAVLERKVGAAHLVFEGGRVVAHVVARKEGEQHHVRVVGPHALAQGQELVPGAIARDAEVERLDLAPRAEAARGELLRQQPPEGALHLDLHRLGVRVAQDGDAVGAGGLRQRMLAVSPALAVDAHVGAALVRLPALHAGSQAATGERIGLPELDKRKAGGPQGELAGKERERRGRQRQRGVPGRAPNPARTCAHSSA